MRETGKNNYFFLNREGRWPGFKWTGLDLRKDGALQLASLPLLSGVLPDEFKTAEPPDGPTGIAIDSRGTLYFSDPENNRVLRIDGCDTTVTPMPCLGGTGDLLTQFRTPRGLLVPPNRNALFVVDSGNHRIQVFDLDTFQLVDVWGPHDPGAPPQPGSMPGQFNEPWSLAGDAAGNVYVVDYGNRRLQKFNALGEVVPSFWDKVSSYSSLQEPVAVAVCGYDQYPDVRIFVLDIASSRIFAFDQDGYPALDPNGSGDPHVTLTLLVSGKSLIKPMGMAANRNALFVGDNDTKRVLRYQITDFSFVGEAIGYEGPVSALLLDGKGGLWVHAGDSLPPIKLNANDGYRMRGSLWSDVPVQVSDRSVLWHRLQALIEPLAAANAHVELFVHTSDDPTDVPLVEEAADNPFSKWRPQAIGAQIDVPDLYIGGAATKYLWIGVLLTGDGKASPVISQLRIEFDYPSYSRYLPAIYRNEANCDEFLERLLSLFESIFNDVEQEIEYLPRLFDPRVTPKDFLNWLAGVLGLDLDENWNDEKQRQIIAEIFRIYGRRGTPAGLREILRIFAGVDAKIEEPIMQAAWWSLPGSTASCCRACGSNSTDGGSWQATENSILGVTTMLAAAQPQGAVVGTSAVLDRSSLITVDEFGSPLFADVAYQFSVQIFRGQLKSAETLPRIRAILDQNKPAHTTYHLCIVEPHLRVGFQSRIGIDTFVGGQSRTLSLGTDQALGQDTALTGAPSSRLGVESQLGLTTRLT